MAASRQLPAPWEENFRANLVRLREGAGMTQTDLARALRDYGLAFHQQTVQRIEAGDRPLRLNEAIAVSKIFQQSLEGMTQSLDHEAEVTDFLRAECVVADTGKRLSRLKDEVQALTEVLRQMEAQRDEAAKRLTSVTATREIIFETRAADDGEHPAET